MLDKKQLLEVIMIPVVISLAFVIVTPMYEEWVTPNDEKPITRKQLSEELKKIEGSEISKDILVDVLTTYDDSKITIDTFTKLLNNENVKEFNELRLNWNKKLEFVNLDLEWKNFKGINLKSVTFINSDLSNIDLSYADLSGIKFSGILVNSDLSYADLRGADLSRADLRNNDLSNTKLDGATLVDTIFLGSNFTDSKIWRADLTGAVLMSSNLSNIEIIDSDLSNVNLRNSILIDAIIWDTKFIGASLQDANFLNANLGYNDFTGAILASCFDDSILNEVQNFPFPIKAMTDQGAIYKEC